jgi:uncharacterized protein (DUF2236 family)
VAVDLLVEHIQLERKDAFELLQAGASRDTEREWFHCYVLAAAMTDENGHPLGAGEHSDVAFRVNDQMAPIEREAYIDRYLEFADEYDPTTLTDDEVEEIIAAEGKLADGSTWKQFGSSALRSLLTTLVPRLIRAEMALEQYKEQEAAQDGTMARIDQLERQLAALGTSLTPRSSDGSGSQSG